MEMHKCLADRIQPLMVYSFDLANAHVKAKIEPMKSHIIPNLSSVTLAFFTLYSALQQTQFRLNIC